MKTIALLRQRHRKTTNGAIIATTDDYERAWELLLASFDAAATHGITEVIRETVEAIDLNEKDVSEVDLVHRLWLSKQAISWRVKRALEKKWLVNDGSRTRRPYRLRRGQALPPRASLPHPHDVEYAFFGVPRPTMNVQFLEFVTTITSNWPAGFTVADWQPRAPRHPTLCASGSRSSLRRSCCSMIRWRTAKSRKERTARSAQHVRALSNCPTVFGREEAG